MEQEPTLVALSLISHTNVGKTTLARTLLRREIGEVRDAAHVTLEAERYTLIETGGARLELWDTPGLGDSIRLAKRLAGRSNPIGWFMSEVWDRFRDRAFWSSQRALRNILDEAEVVLYLVNAAEAPADIGYLDAELEVMALLGKPVIVLLNQMGPPKAPQDEAAELTRWRERTRSAASVRGVLALDAFARCWVQEDTLLALVSETLPRERRAAFATLRAAWRARNVSVWRASMQVLAQRVARASLDREVVKPEGWTGRLRQMGAALGLRGEGTLTAQEYAMQALAERLDTAIRESTDRLIALHGLEGKASEVVLERLTEHFAVRAPVSEGKAALWGGVVTGALAGLKADLASGGLTMGAGLLAGGVIGALGAAGLARGYNLVRGVDAPRLTWSIKVLEELARAALLGYLAVAHYGRGRGEWSASEHPVFWNEHVDAVMSARRAGLVEILERTPKTGDAPPIGESPATAAFDEALQRWFEDASVLLLAGLYPDAGSLLHYAKA